jgi:hypothetical protein
MPAAQTIAGEPGYIAGAGEQTARFGAAAGGFALVKRLQ